jgi:hypothetical protein
MHKIWLGITTLIGLPIAGLSLLLLMPASHNRSPAVFLLLVPIVLVAWAISLLFRMFRTGRTVLQLRRELLVFYALVGAVAVQVSTWSFSRDGTTGTIFTPEITLIVALFFIIPFVQIFRTTAENPSSPRNDSAAKPLPKQ